MAEPADRMAARWALPHLAPPRAIGHPGRSNCAIMHEARSDHPEGGEAEDRIPPVELIPVYENRPEGYEGTCLRPLGLCELGGSCDTCWYSPDHPRHREKHEG